MNKKQLVLLSVILFFGLAVYTLLVFSKEVSVPKPFEQNLAGREHPVYYRDQVVVLLYHDISEPECGTSISPERFADHLRMLEEEGFMIVSLGDIKSFLNEGSPLPVNAVAITLDDACVSNYKEVLPTLKSRHWPFAVFVTVSEIGKIRPNGLSRRLYWQEIQEMARTGVVVGSHTYNGHQKWKNQQGEAYWLTNQQTGETSRAYQHRILADLQKSRAILTQETQQEVLDFAPPFGAYNADTIRLAQQAGYKYIWTTHPVPVSRCSPLTSLGRVSVGIKGTSPEQLKNRILETAESSP